MSNTKKAAGRPKTGRVPVGLRLSPEVRAFLQTKDNQSLFIESLVRRDMGFIQANWKGWDNLDIQERGG